MPNTLDGDGLKTKTADEIKNSLITGLKAIYGDDINTDPETPDGQLIGIFAQAALDNLELLQQVYASFGVDGAFGISLDQRVALNGLTRRAGTFTFTDVVIVTDRALNLTGLDTQLDVDVPTGNIYTVADAAGNKWYLAASQTIAGAGSQTVSFRAANRGAVLTTLNTITNQVTVTTGVTSVNNPSAATSTGVDEESDAALRIRHARSFQLAAIGPSDALAAAIYELANVTDVFVAENDTAAEANGVPAHSIWAIVEGGEDYSIAQAIYAKKIAGCGQQGSVSVNVERPNGTNFIAKFDRPIDQDLYVKLTLVPRVAGVTFDTTVVKDALAAALVYKLNQPATIGDVVVAMLAIAPQGMVTTVGVSDNGSSWYDIKDPDDYQHKWVASADRITVTV